MQLRGTADVRSDINVTPLVDVVLVLLIIFMVVTPMLGTQDVELPSTYRPALKPEDPGTKNIVLTHTGEIRVDDRSFSTKELQKLLTELYQRQPQTMVLLHADRRLSYGDVYKVMEVISSTGFRNISLMSQPQERSH